VITFFSEQFNINSHETIALMGAHTLGRAREGNSGYEGPWVRGPGATEILDNRFYTELVDRPWVHVTTEGRKPQWQLLNSNRNLPDEENSNMFIDTDSCLVDEFTLDENNLASCAMCANRLSPPANIDQGCCSKSAGFTDAQAFSRSVSLLLFFIKWLKNLMAHYQNQLQDLLQNRPQNRPQNLVAVVVVEEMENVNMSVIKADFFTVEEQQNVDTSANETDFFTS